MRIVNGRLLSNARREARGSVPAKPAGSRPGAARILVICAWSPACRQAHAHINRTLSIGVPRGVLKVDISPSVRLVMNAIASQPAGPDAVAPKERTLLPPQLMRPASWRLGRQCIKPEKLLQKNWTLVGPATDESSMCPRVCCERMLYRRAAGAAAAFVPLVLVVLPPTLLTRVELCDKVKALGRHHVATASSMCSSAG
jgi:hypothetical protein